jgi:hypothetical protein
MMKDALCDEHADALKTERHQHSPARLLGVEDAGRVGVFQWSLKGPFALSLGLHKIVVYTTSATARCCNYIRPQATRGESRILRCIGAVSSCVQRVALT